MSPIPFATKNARCIDRVGVLFCVINSSRTYGPFNLNGIRRAFRFAVGPIPRLFRRSVNVDVLAKVLSGNYSANGGFVCVHRIRIATRDRILNAPIISPRGQIRVESAKFPNYQVARVPRVHFAHGEWYAFNGLYVVRLFKDRVLRVVLCVLGSFHGNAKAWNAFTGRVFFAQVNLRFGADRSHAFLPAVVLLFR